MLRWSTVRNGRDNIVSAAVSSFFFPVIYGDIALFVRARVRTYSRCLTVYTSNSGCTGMVVVVIVVVVVEER
jgi:hypothetical protein